MKSQKCAGLLAKNIFPGLIWNFTRSICKTNSMEAFAKLCFITNFIFSLYAGVTFIILISTAYSNYPNSNFSAYLCPIHMRLAVSAISSFKFFSSFVNLILRWNCTTNKIMFGFHLVYFINFPCVHSQILKW